MKLRYLIVAALVGAAGTLAVSAAIGASSSNRNVLFAVMTGKKEVSTTTGKKGAGDLNARGGATIVIDGTDLCFGLVVKNLDTTPIAAHIHKARPSKNGPIVVPLTAPSAADPGASSGCVTIDSTLAQKLQKNPSKYYVNVHTTDFPNGAMRGQLYAKRK